MHRARTPASVTSWSCPSATWPGRDGRHSRDARAPREIAIAPAPALERAVSAAGWTVAELDGIEINEAFACVPLASVRVLAVGAPGVEQDLLARLNVNGGAVAIGHPPGASGARLVLTLGRRLHAAGGGRGAASICGGLGQADAVALEVA